MIVFWAVAAGVFLALEAITAAMCSIWFAAGSVLALVIAAIGGKLWLQIVVFCISSGLCFWFLYPRLKKAMGKSRQPTNADMTLGQTCTVTDRIDNLAGTGTVFIGGKTWSARTIDGSVIEPDTLATVEQIRGVKLIVKPAQSEVKI